MSTSMSVPERPVSLSGLTEPEAKEFHAIFVRSFIIFTAICLFAHFMVWFLWRPWVPGPNGYTSMLLTHGHSMLAAASMGHNLLASASMLT